MGLYSTIWAPLQCNCCGFESEVDVQFKYGNLWVHEYMVGDSIAWGRTQVGEPSEIRVAALGTASCPRCHEEACFDVIIERGRIKSVQSSRGEYDYHHGEGDYVIISND